MHCHATGDVRVNNSMSDGSAVQLVSWTGGSGPVTKIGAAVSAGTLGQYCNGCWVVGYNMAIQFPAACGQPMWSGPNAPAFNCSHSTLTVTGACTDPNGPQVTMNYYMGTTVRSGTSHGTRTPIVTLM
jgi:hypothetical protein